MGKFWLNLFLISFFDVAMTIEIKDNKVGKVEGMLYEGVRVDMKAITMNRDILYIITPGMNRTKNHTFKDVYESGGFGSLLHISNIKINSYEISEDRFIMNQFTFNPPNYTLHGTFESINFFLTFDYSMTWIGIPLASGSGKGSVTNLPNEIIVYFNESDPDIDIPKPWDVLNITVSWSLFTPTAWIESLLEKRFLDEFDRVIDDAMYDFAHKLLKSYRRIEDVMPDETDLVFGNDIIGVKATLGNEYISIGFDTNITVNQHIVRKLYRRMTGTITSEGDFSVCFASQLIPDVLDSLGKAGYYDVISDYLDWNFPNNSVYTLATYIPSLKQRYAESDTFVIECQISRFLATNDLNPGRLKETNLVFQNPIHCFMIIETSGEYAISLDVFARLYYCMKTKGTAYFGYTWLTHLAGFSTYPLLPQSKMDLLANKVECYVNNILKNPELISPGIQVLPTRNSSLNFKTYEVKSEEICFHFDEQRT